ncbi:ArsR family transcriptional regulator [Parapedobacter pyrenivorans]|uniref:ArsR family transcriptional regulator n=1 Tax=Parapedobacter pyrenivorans TaxID=1305674 RepID=A0A917HKK6_9SPHI|nr:ATP-binding protein [Parapedobacter pyrenivorans]GGG81562.1 ArsR family transcriptional regulator [Parapedobacter pyrenivorans]
MEQQVIGRVEEIAVLNETLTSNRAELVAIYGRRRIGKTFLVRQFFARFLKFELSGSQNANMETQLFNFATVLGKSMNLNLIPRPPANWSEAFIMLGNYIEQLKGKDKKVIFLDELPWLDSLHSGFLSAFDYFWNAWCTKRTDIIVVICGSAASWMIEKILFNKGGLHNRITRQIRLLPFTLRETKAFFHHKRVKLNDYQIAELYMTIGGVPHYLDLIRSGKSATQNIDDLCFSPQGMLRNEFEKLYSSLYDQADNHIAIIRALSKRRSGLTRNEIVADTKLTSGGYLTGILRELEESGFITAYLPINRKSKDAIIRLTDEYSLFYLKFIEKSRAQQKATWALLSTKPTWKAWSGYAFENLCLKHVENIKMALQIGSIYSEEATWYDRQAGAQIDLVIDRADRCVNLCEIKFSEAEYTINAKYAKELHHKMLAYKTSLKSKKTTFTTLITTYGIAKNEYKDQYVDSEVTLAQLF